MNNRALLSALAVCFTVVGCDTRKPADPPKPRTEAAVVPVPPTETRPLQVVDNKAGSTTPAAPPKGRGGCGSGRCVVKITVDDKCQFTYAPDKISVFGPNVIRWTVSGGWLFQANGIELPSGGGQFSSPTGAGTATFSWKDANTDKLEYKYTVNVSKGGKNCKGDPSVVNGADFEEN